MLAFIDGIEQRKHGSAREHHSPMRVTSDGYLKHTVKNSAKDKAK